MKSLLVTIPIYLFAITVSLPADDAIVSSAEFIRTFGVPEKEMNRLISIEEPPTVAITIHFDTDSAEIKGSHNITQLEQLGLALQSPDLAGRIFSIEGHTDKRGESAYNLKLSQRRSIAVVDYLADNFGIAREQLESNGQGEYFLLDDGDSAEAHAKNRRVEIVLNGTLAE